MQPQGSSKNSEVLFSPAVPFKVVEKAKIRKHTEDYSDFKYLAGNKKSPVTGQWLVLCFSFRY